MASVKLTDAAREDLRDLDGAARKIVAKALKKLEDEPNKRGLPLGSQNSGNLTGFRKLVVGDRDYRIIYRTEGEVVVIVWVIAKRSDNECYDLATSRLNTYQGDPALMRQLQTMMNDVWSATE